MDSEVKSYEIAYLISPDIPEDEVFGQAGKITAAIQEVHGLVGRIEEPKKRYLAYPIQKRGEAYFGWTTFSVAPERLAEIEKKISREPNIIRHLVVEEVRRPVPEFRPARPAGGPARPRPAPRAPEPALEGIKPFTPAAPREEDKAKIEELDKKLEEILGT